MMRIRLFAESMPFIWMIQVKFLIQRQSQELKDRLIHSLKIHMRKRSCKRSRKANGTFKSGEINVVFSYSSNPDPLKQMLPFVYVGTGLIIALCAASVIYSSNKRKKRIMAELDIEED